MFSQTHASPAASRVGFTPPAALGPASLSRPRDARPPAPGSTAPARAPRSLRGRLSIFRERWIARNELARMDGRMLRDIALTPAEARREAGKPFWRA